MATMIDRSISTSYFPAGRGYGAPGACAATAPPAATASSDNPFHRARRQRRCMGLVVSGEENPTTIRWFATQGTRRYGEIGEGGMAASHSCASRASQQCRQLSAPHREDNAAEQERNHLTGHVPPTVEDHVRSHAAEHDDDDEQRAERRGSAQKEQDNGSQLGDADGHAEPVGIAPMAKRSGPSAVVEELGPTLRSKDQNEQECGYPGSNDLECPDQRVLVHTVPRGRQGRNARYTRTRSTASHRTKALVPRVRGTRTTLWRHGCDHSRSDAR